MNVKKILKLDKLKAAVISILFFPPFIFQYIITATRDNEAYGFPFPFILKMNYQCAVGGPCPEPHYVFIWIFLVIDIILLYLITSLIIFLYEKFIKSVKNNITLAVLLGSILFLVFIVISYIFSIGYPFIKVMTGIIGSPLVFYAFDPWTGPGIQIDSIFLWQYLIIDIVYWYIISILLIWVQNKFGDN